MLAPSATKFPQLAPPTAVDEAIVAAGLRQSEIDALRSHCTAARDTAHCPYSSFRVGATLLSAKDGLLISGGNFENAAFPAGTCAERVALGSAVTTGGLRLGDFRAVGVATDLLAREGHEEDFCSPCGMCRQALREFCSVDVPIFMFDAEGRFVVKTLGQLLPMSFGPDKLPHKGDRRP